MLATEMVLAQFETSSGRLGICSGSFRGPVEGTALALPTADWEGSLGVRGTAPPKLNKIMADMRFLLGNIEETSLHQGTCA